MGQSSDVNEGERFKPILIEDGFLFSAQVRDDGLICNYSDQDYIHDHKKLDRHLDHQTRTLYPIHRNFLRQVLDVFHPQEHGLRQEDVNKRDVQNWASCQTTTFSKVRQCLLNLINGINCPQANNLTRGLWAYLNVLYHYLEIFLSLRASLTARIEYSSYVVHFLGIWRSYIIMSRDLPLKENFLSRETFQDILLSCHFAALMIIDFGENYSYLECCLDCTGSDGCEVFFRSNSSWIRNHHSYTILDMLRNHSAMTRLAEIRATNRNLQFRRAHSKQDNIWDQQYPAGERDIRSNLKEYPSREEAVSAWRRGAVRAQNMARRVGMHPFDEDVQIDDEHGSDGGGGDGGSGGGGGAGGDEGGGGDSGSGGRSGAGDAGSGELSHDQNGEESCGKETVSSDWFYRPFKSLKYK